MNFRPFIGFVASLLVLGSCASNKDAEENLPSIKWIEGVSEGRNAVHTILITNASALPEDWTIYFSQGHSGVGTADGPDAAVSHIKGTFHKITPLSVEKKDTIVVHLQSRAIRRRSLAPHGFILKTAEVERVLPVSYEFLPLKEDGGKWFEYNESHIIATEVPAAAIIPTPKNRVCKNRPQGWYSVAVTENGEEVIEANDEDGVFYAKTTLNQLRENYAPGNIPPMVIEDWPDFEYRGYMLDVARNFTKKDDLLRLIDLMARYKLNYLHLHFGDDEGWRIEIDGIPELTTLGAFHSLDPTKGLQPSHDGNADPTDLNSSANGYYSIEEFKEILRYAWERRIRVIPEFDTPGHSRASIMAMRAYEERTGDCSMRLQDPEDDSEYMSVQRFDDNVIGVELESTYTFIGRIFDEIAKMYSDAGVPLPAIHIGGDEVAEGAWHGVDRLEEHMGKVARIAKEKGIKIAGWQEVALIEDPAIAKAVKEVLFFNNAWNTFGTYSDLPFRNAAKGYPTVMSNAQYTYVDMAYSSNAEEIAADWAGYIDDFKAFSTPARLMPNLLGVQAQLWTETVRTFDDVCYDTFPKALGVFERGWNCSATQTADEFYAAIVAHEMPYWEKNGVKYHLPQPGLKVVDGQVVTNTLVPGATVEVTEDADRIYATTKLGTNSSVRSCVLK